MENKVFPEQYVLSDNREYSSYFRKFLLVSAIFFRIFDLVLDIVLYTQLNVIEEGLLIGKLDAFIQGELILCIMGGIMLIIEIILVVLKYSKTNYMLPYHCGFVFFLWAKDLPQMIINFLIVFCSGVPVNTLQLMKMSSLFLFAILLTVDLLCYVKISKLNGKLYKGFTIISNILYLLCCSSLLFLLVGKKAALFSSSSSQSLASPFNPDNEYNYFSDVGIFVNQQVYFNSDDLASTELNTENNWIQLATIDQLRAAPQTELTIVLQYKRRIDLMSLVVWKENIRNPKEVNQTWIQSSCYTFEPLTVVLKVNESKVCIPTTIDKQIFIKLRYNPPTSNLFYGNIVYKAMKLENRGCEIMEDYTEILRPTLYGSSTIKMHYFRKNDANDASPLKHSKGLTRFFKYGLSSYPDLTDVSEIWKTELLGCSLNSVFKPKLDKSISMNCYFQNF